MTLRFEVGAMVFFYKYVLRSMYIQDLKYDEVEAKSTKCQRIPKRKEHLLQTICFEHDVQEMCFTLFYYVFLVLVELIIKSASTWADP